VENFTSVEVKKTYVQRGERVSRCWRLVIPTEGLLLGKEEETSTDKVIVQYLKHEGKKTLRKEDPAVFGSD
jgi:hypothetical protein